MRERPRVCLAMMGVIGIFPNKAQHELGQHFADSRSPHPCASSHGVSITSHRLIRLTSKHNIPQDLASYTNCAEGGDAVTFNRAETFPVLDFDDFFIWCRQECI